MEKFSQFRDPFTGIHPFLNPKRRMFRLQNYIRLLFRLFALPLLYLMPNLLIKINTNKAKLKTGTYICNKSSFLDTFVLKYLFCANITDLSKNSRIKTKDVTNVVFVEECKSNNKCIMKYVKQIQSEGVIGLNYSDSCIRMYGSWFWYLLYFLGSDNKVNVKVIEGSSDLEEATGLTKTDIGKKEWCDFLVALNKK
ncbi:hypothetical protein BDAP_002594 [Binucleata daphniae]